MEVKCTRISATYRIQAQKIYRALKLSQVLFESNQDDFLFLVPSATLKLKILDTEESLTL